MLNAITGNSLTLRAEPITGVLTFNLLDRWDSQPSQDDCQQHWCLPAFTIISVVLA